ncbi:TIGR00252 family protein [Bifidobacterium longum subsp. longum]|nr:TIGR00252 family protein [Bifidobacterium longum subsp. longum]
MNALPPTQPTTKSGIDAGLAFHQPMLASPDPQAMLPSERIAATMGDRNLTPQTVRRARRAVCRRVAGGTRLDDLEPQLAYPLRRIGHRDAQSRVHGGVRRSEITPVHALRISARGHYAGETAQSQESRLRLAT